ncbi:hypothetical protein CCHL11_05101 [Colletotrichum chlorophyti]|uniref:Uncharacterized protein n=1 Tax=Colletotrichum chlorophyti TaxID=708187 RepID=A0A1Q8S3C3_9PEZI|nr:hypothetical protein CCHL11_05101 [Colletotrichum chlorophyti]
MKKLIEIYKTHLRRLMGVDKSSKTVSKPFIRLNIECILGSYDPNVTTAKDEVIFANEAKVLSLFEELCKETYHPVAAEVKIVEENAQAEKPNAKWNSPLLQVGYDGEIFGELLQYPELDKTLDADETPAGLPSPSSVQGPTSLSERVNRSNHLTVNAKVQHVATRADSSNDVDDCSEARSGNLARDVAKSAHDAQPELTGNPSKGKFHENQRSSYEGSSQPSETRQIKLRLGWEVNMSRDDTASPEANTQTILLNPPQMDVTEYLQSQRVAQTQRDNPNPWSLAQKAARARGTQDENGLQTSAQPTQGSESAGIAASHKWSFTPTMEESMQQGPAVDSDIRIEDRESLPVQQSRHHRIHALRRGDFYEADDLESQTLHLAAIQPGRDHVLRRQEELGILRNEVNFQPLGVRHNVDDFEIGLERGAGVRQRAFAKTPHPLAEVERESGFGTPPFSSSPMNKPFRVPFQLRPGTQNQKGQVRATQGVAKADNRMTDGLRQSKITFQGHGLPRHKDTADDSSGPVRPACDDIMDSFSGAAGSRYPRCRVSPSPSEQEMNAALERLDALRPRTISTGHNHRGESIDERGRSLSRRPTTTVPNMSPRRYLNKRLVSRSRSRTKTHKRMRSEMLPFERVFSEPHTRMQLVTLDHHKIREQIFNASEDLYVLRGVQQYAFPLEQYEMDDVGKKLQEAFSAWAQERYGAGMELEIDIGVLFKGLNSE